METLREHRGVLRVISHCVCFTSEAFILDENLFLNILWISRNPVNAWNRQEHGMKVGACV